MIFTDSFVSFHFGKGGSASLSNALFVALKPPFPFRQVQLVPTEACTISQDLRWSRQHQEVCHFYSFHLHSDSRPVLATLSFSLFFLPQALWQICFLSSFTLRLQWVPGHSFLPENETVDELARLGALLLPSSIPCSFPPLNFRIRFYRFLDWKRTVSSVYFDT